MYSFCFCSIFEKAPSLFPKMPPTVPIRTDYGNVINSWWNTTDTANKNVAASAGHPAKYLAFSIRKIINNRREMLRIFSPGEHDVHWRYDVIYDQIPNLVHLFLFSTSAQRYTCIATLNNSTKLYFEPSTRGRPNNTCPPSRDLLFFSFIHSILHCFIKCFIICRFSE